MSLDHLRHTLNSSFSFRSHRLHGPNNSGAWWLFLVRIGRERNQLVDASQVRLFETFSALEISVLSLNPFHVSIETGYPLLGVGLEVLLRLGEVISVSIHGRLGVVSDDFKCHHWFGHWLLLPDFTSNKVVSGEESHLGVEGDSSRPLFEIGSGVPLFIFLLVFHFLFQIDFLHELLGREVQTFLLVGEMF